MCTVCVCVCVYSVCLCVRVQCVCVDDSSPLSSLPVQHPSFLLPLSRPKRSPPALNLLWCFCGVSFYSIGVSIVFLWCICCIAVVLLWGGDLLRMCLMPDLTVLTLT